MHRQGCRRAHSGWVLVCVTLTRVVRESRPSLTARWVAAQRARLHESRPFLPDGEPEAERSLYLQLGRAFSLPGLRPTGMGLRTRFIDEEVLRAISDGIDQIVLVGAGYDARALRFRQPGVRWFEVDHPATQPDKRQRMQRVGDDLGHVTFVPVNLLVDDIRAHLDAAGLAVARPSLFICEGLFTYLPNEAVSALCRQLFELSAQRSTLVASILVVPPRRGRLAPQSAADALLALLGERRLGIFHYGTAEQLLRQAGWGLQRRAATRPARFGGSQLAVIAAQPA